MSNFLPLRVFPITGLWREKAPSRKVPFEAELYALAPERFGDWHEGGAPLPPGGPDALTDEQMNGELALLVLRRLCWGALSTTVLGLILIIWRVSSGG